MYPGQSPSPQSPYSLLYPSPGSNSPIDTIHPSPVSSNHLENSIPFGLPSLTYSSSSSASSSRSSSRLEPFDLLPNLANLTFDDLETHSQLDDFFPIPSQHHDSSFLNGFVDSCSPEQSTRLVSGGDNGELCSGLGNDESFSYHQPVHSSPPSITHGTTTLNSTPYSDHSSHVHHFSTAPVIDHNNAFFDSSVTSHVSDPDSEDLDHYRELYLEPREKHHLTSQKRVSSLHVLYRVLDSAPSCASPDMVDDGEASHACQRYACVRRHICPIRNGPCFCEKDASFLKG